MKKILVCLKDIEKSYGIKILSIDELNIFAGECLIITGKNGSGKSTLLKIIAGLVSADKGNIFYKDKTFSAKKRHLLTSKTTYLASKAYLFDCNVENNIGYPLLIKKQAKRKQQVEKILNWGGLMHLRKKHPNSLSSGEIQRVALARAKIINPKIWLLDEPAENLDKDSKQQFYQLLNKLLIERRSIIIATHSEEISQNVPNRILQLTEQQLKNAHH